MISNLIKSIRINNAKANTTVSKKDNNRVKTIRIKSKQKGSKYSIRI